MLLKYLTGRLEDASAHVPDLPTSADAKSAWIPRGQGCAWTTTP